MIQYSTPGVALDMVQLVHGAHLTPLTTGAQLTVRQPYILQYLLIQIYFLIQLHTEYFLDTIIFLDTKLLFDAKILLDVKMLLDTKLLLYAILFFMRSSIAIQNRCFAF